MEEQARRKGAVLLYGINLSQVEEYRMPPGNPTVTSSRLGGTISETSDQQHHCCVALPRVSDVIISKSDQCTLYTLTLSRVYWVVDRVLK